MEYGRANKNSLQPKFISQSQIDFPLNYLKNLVFLYIWLINGKLIKICAEISTGNKYPSTCSVHSPKSANHLGYLKKVLITKAIENRYDIIQRPSGS